jgi:vitamin B12 transporter
MKRFRVALPLLASLLLFLFTAAVIAQDSNNAKPATSDKPNGNQYQLDELVVTATKVETPAKEVGSSITVITKRQIEEQQQSTVLDVLRSVPSLDIVQSGGLGRTTSVFIRGADSEHTLVLIDGVEMNDPISAGRSFDFANLTTDNIDRIEILRGPQSTLYGSDAIGGVINIITKTGEGKPDGFFSVEGGSLKSFREAGGFYGGNKRIRYSLGFSRQDTDGISAAGEKYGNTEKDGYGNTSVSGKLGITPAHNLNVDVIFRRIDAKADLDNNGGIGGDDPNSTTSSTEHYFRTQARLLLFHNIWDQKIGFSLTNNSRAYKNDVDAAHPNDSNQSSYDGNIYKFDWQNNFNIHRTNILTAGLETEEEKGKSDYYSMSAYGPYSSIFKEKTARTNGYYLQDQVKLWGSWFTTLGVRLDDHSRFGTESTYHIASAYVFEKSGTKIKGSYGTGFKAPSLYQLYSTYGDQNLKPEESTGWDAGIEQSFICERLTIDATYFNNNFENLVEFNSATYRYTNVAKAKTRGIEFSASIHASETLIFRGSYTFTDAKDKETGLDLLRRARNKAGFDANYRFMGKGNINFNLIRVGKRADISYSSHPASRVETAGYVLANVAGSYDLTKHFQVIGRVNNLLNRDYEEVVGFGTPGVSAFGGIKVSF